MNICPLCALTGWLQELQVVRINPAPQPGYRQWVVRRHGVAATESVIAFWNLRSGAEHDARFLNGRNHTDTYYVEQYDQATLPTEGGWWTRQESVDWYCIHCRTTGHSPALPTKPDARPR